MRQTLIEELERIARDNDTSFNNVVVSMIEQCLEDIHSEEAREREEVD